MTKLIRFLKDDSGATAIEYGLLAALIAVALITSVSLPRIDHCEQILGYRFGNQESWDLNSHRQAMLMADRALLGRHRC